MATKITKVSSLNPAVNISPSDLLYIVQVGPDTSNKVTVADLTMGMADSLDLNQYVKAVQAGTGVTVDNTDPQRPIISGGGATAAWGFITGTLTDQVDLANALALKANISSLADVATSGNYSSLIGKPSLSTVALTGSYVDLTGKPVLSTVAITGQYSDLIGSPTYSTVATTGSYSDLSDKPTLGTAAAANSTDFASALQGAKADSAIQAITAGTNITIDVTNPLNPVISAAADVAAVWGSITGTLSNQTDLQGALDAKANTTDLSTVATTGSYSDLSDTPTLGTAASASTGDFATAAQGAKADSAIQSITAGTNITIDATDPLNPTISAAADVAAVWGSITGTISDQTDLQAALDDKANTTDLSTVATSGSYNDLSDTPTLGTAAFAATGDFATAAQGAKADTALQSVVAGTNVTVDATDPLNPIISAADVAAVWGSITGTLADQTDLQAALDDKADTTDLSTVATSGSYSDLSDTPTLGTAAAANSTDFATAAQGAKADTALQSVVAGTNVTVDATDPLNPIVSAATQPATQQAFPVVCSDENTPITTGTSKITFRMPFAFTLTGVRASLSTAQTSGSVVTVDINKDGVSVLSTQITIDNTEKTSTTADVVPVISDSAIADDAEISIDIDQIGDGTAAGLKVYLIGHQ